MKRDFQAKWIQNYKKVVNHFIKNEPITNFYLKSWVHNYCIPYKHQNNDERKKLLDNFFRRFGDVKRKDNKYHYLIYKQKKSNPRTMSCPIVINNNDEISDTESEDDFGIEEIKDYGGGKYDNISNENNSNIDDFLETRKKHIIKKKLVEINDGNNKIDQLVEGIDNENYEEIDNLFTSKKYCDENIIIWFDFIKKIENKISSNREFEQNEKKWIVNQIMKYVEKKDIFSEDKGINSYFRLFLRNNLNESRFIGKAISLIALSIV
jgi:hypothetical protein